ncbi:MAG: type II secretion system protein N [Cocleimonas sp.]|nr:type II secretion system protein N [Cocleimonas sp.]
MKVRNLILLGISSFTIAAIWKTPASFAYQYLPVKAVQLNGISGTIWNGEIKDLQYKKLNLNNITWSVDPLKSLQSLSLKTHLEIQDPDLTLKGLMGIDIDQTLMMEDTQVETNGAFVSRLQKIAKLTGDFSATINYFSLAKGQLPELDAHYQWKRGKLIAPIRISSAGDYSVVVTSSNKGLNAKISSSAAPLAIKGEANIDKEWVYNAHVNIAPSNDNPSSKGIMNMLRMATGQLEADGSAVIKQQGKAKPFY